MRLGGMTPWVRAFLTGHRTRIRLPGHLSDAFRTPIGIPTAHCSLDTGEQKHLDRWIISISWLSQIATKKTSSLSRKLSEELINRLSVAVPSDPYGHDRMPLAVLGNELLDKQLKFNTHRKKLLTKASGSLEALRGCHYTARLIGHIGLVLSYSTLNTSIGDGKASAAILIRSAFKCISTAAWDIELFLTLMKLRLQQTIEETAIHILTSPL
ncbi:hypothetical protein N7467_000766 [Penicillium canescens]|nr:hypothetical protein N7467_000766 [Penicillium canescens]